MFRKKYNNEINKIVEQAAHPLAILDINGEWISANNHMLKLFSIDTKIDLINDIKNFNVQLNSSLLYKFYIVCLKNYLNNRIPESQIFEYDFPDTKYIKFMFKNFSLKNHKTLIMLMVYDLTIEQRAIKQFQLKADAFDYSSEGIFIADRDKKIIMINPAYETITGFTQEDVCGYSPKFMQSEMHTPEFYDNIWKTLENEGRWSGEVWDKKKNGDVYPRMLSITTICNVNKEISNYLGFFTDISLLKESKEFIQYISYYDALTGLPNRTLFKDRLQQGVIQAERNNWKLVVLILNLDRFKLFNDTLGYSVGDWILTEVGERIKKCIFERDTVARFSNDEFAIILNDISTINQAAQVSQRIIEEIASAFTVEDKDYYITASIGITLYPDDGLEVTKLLRNADTALDHAKKRGKNNYQFYAEEMNSEAMARLVMENNIRRGIDKGEFILYYQPQIDVKSGEMVGVESLVRWQHPELGLVSPDTFITIAEDTGLIVPLGKKLLKMAVAQNKEWQDLGYKKIKVGVNISARQFKEGDLLNFIKNTLTEFNLAPEFLELELTESILMDGVSEAYNILAELKEMGVQLAIDDFGTGYSSLTYLKKFTVDKIKIDKSFISEVLTNTEDAAITAAIIALSRGLNLNVIAEGVESEEQISYLFKSGCSEIQGYYYSKPVPPEVIAKYLQEKKIFTPMPGM